MARNFGCDEIPSRLAVKVAVVALKAPKRRGVGAERPVKWSEIPLEVPSQDHESVPFIRVAVISAYMSSISAALRAIRRKIGVYLGGSAVCMRSG